MLLLATRPDFLWAGAELVFAVFSNCFTGALAICDMHAQVSAAGVSQSFARATEPLINETKPNNASTRYFIWFDTESSLRGGECPVG